VKISLDNALGIHPDALQLRSQRTQILANNIANADTPGFKAQDIDFKQMLENKMAGSSGTLATTRSHPGHMTSNGGGFEAAEMMYRMPSMPSLDGNSVDAQVEQAEFAENSLQFMASLRFVNGRLGGLLTAIKGE